MEINEAYGHLEQRLQDFHDSGLTGLSVEPGAISARLADASGEPLFILRVDGGGRSSVSFSAYELTDGGLAGMGRRLQGPRLSLADLMAQHDGDDDHFWRHAASALLGLYEVADAMFDEAMDDAVTQCAERLNGQWQRIASPPPFPDIAGAFAAFKEACQRRAPFCEGIQLSWGARFEDVPDVVFGLAPGTPEQILYQTDARRSKSLYLNGFWAARYSLEEDIAEHLPNDEWARLGARNAARDLVEIQDSAHKLMEERRKETLGDLDQERSRIRLQSILQGAGPLSDPAAWDAHAAEWLQGDCEQIFGDIRDYLNSLHPGFGE